jgi:hypothetical protein
LTVDDVQKKAQYHSACITNWKKDHSADNYSTIKNESEHDIALKKFLDILHHDLFENKKAFTMSSLLDKCCSLLSEGLSTKYSTTKLQTRLQNHYGDTIVIESQKGQGQSPKLNGVKLFLCNGIIISATAIHCLALSCDNAL